MEAVDIQTGEILEGHLPPKAFSMVREWIDLNREDFLLMWETFSALEKSPELFFGVNVDSGGYGVSRNDDLDLSCDELYANGETVPLLMD